MIEGARVMETREDTIEAEGGGSAKALWVESD